MTLTQKKLNRALGEYWHDDYMRRRSGGWSQKEIAAFYKIRVGKITESCVCKWARKERMREAA